MNRLVSLLGPHKRPDKTALETAGGESTLLTQEKAFRKAFERMDAEYKDLAKQYPYHWVATGPDGVVALAPAPSDPSDLRGCWADGESVVAKAKESAGAGRFVIRFLDPEPMVLIL